MDHLALLVCPDLQEEKYSNKQISILCEEWTWNVFTFQTDFFFFLQGISGPPGVKGDKVRATCTV